MATTTAKKSARQVYVDYMEKDLERLDPTNKTKLAARAACENTAYADWRAKRMNDAPVRLVPSGTEHKVGYCVHVTYPHEWNGKKYISQYTVSCLTTLEKLLKTSATSKDCSFKIVPIKMNRNHYRGYDYVLFDTAGEAEDYLTKLKKTMDDHGESTYKAFKY